MRSTRLPGVVGDEAEHGVAHVPQVVGLHLDLDRRAADARRALVHQDPRVRQRPALALRPRREQELPGAAREPERERRDVVRDQPHHVADREHRRHRSAGRVDPQGDVGCLVLGREREQLRRDQGAVVVVERAVEHEHALVEQLAPRLGAELGDLSVVCHAPSVRGAAGAASRSAPGGSALSGPPLPPVREITRCSPGHLLHAAARGDVASTE